MDYKSRRWQVLRARVLRRDGYCCRECRRYGRRVQAAVAHHVWPAVDYPEYQWADWNLIALCPACHNAMHDRDTGALTDLGERWRSRIAPPPSQGVL